MKGETAPDTPTTLQLTGEDVAALIAQTSDVSFSLAPDGKVTAAVLAPGTDFAFDVMAEWVGRRFVDIVGKDSQSKVAALLGANAALTGGNTRWRHLNLLVDGRPEVPLLAKHFEFDTPDGTARRVLCRDLRPLTELNSRWQNERQQAARQKAQTAQSERAGSSMATATSVLVGAAPLDQIVSAAVDEVVKICLEEALSSVGGNKAEAARLLGISLAELHAREKKHLHS